ncbi:helix-turn-helix domain-containing protein [Pseudomonas paralcaligenes]|uniref:helix-turn-helix domain-containing protein n=1 Tax=Pseudomonas paralcaligenes TaxID=2772558 RepID=UPI001C80CF65|nr:helix-turn-helix transcriptional regulator [Pseudomonas paralcaligenes]
MGGIGDRLREERDRLGLSQAAFGEIGGVKANAQGNYEKGDRSPDAAYLAAVAAHGVDVLYVVTGERTPQAADSITDAEAKVLECYRALPAADQGVVERTAAALAESAGRSRAKP